MHELILGEVHMTTGLFSAHKTARANSVAAEQATIIKAIESGHGDLAERRMQEHLASARKRVLKAMAKDAIA